jgi:hypothetical protein
MPPELKRIYKNFSVFWTFLGGIVAAFALKLGLLLFSKELQLHFTFQCD